MASTFAARARPRAPASAPSSFSASFNGGHTAFHLQQLQWCRPDGHRLWETPLTQSIHSQERVAIVGRNGVGKSVLVHLLARRWLPSSGQLDHAGHVHLVAPPVLPEDRRTVAQAMGVGDTLAAVERLAAGDATPDDLLLADGQWDLPHRIAQALADAGLPHLSPQGAVAQLSGGERMRVALAGAMATQADSVLLDEPSNHLDADARRWLLAWLQRTPTTVVLVSHDRQLLRAVDRTLELSPRGLAIYGGGYDLYAEQRDQQQAAAEAALARARHERSVTLTRLRQEHDALQQRHARARQSARSANMSGMELYGLQQKAQAHAGREALRQADTRNELDRAVRDAAQKVSQVPEVFLALPASDVPARKRVLLLDGVQLPHGADSGGPPIDALLLGPQRVALSGPNGCGKSTLLRTMSGALSPLQGEVQRWVPHALLDQDGGDQLPPDRPLLDHLRALGCRMSETGLRTQLAQLRLDAAKLAQPLGTYSAGERLKAALVCALWRGEPAQLLLLDEPTNHLDLDTTLVLQQALRSYGGALVVASHDDDFLAALRPTQHWRWVDGQLRRELHGEGAGSDEV